MSADNIYCSECGVALTNEEKYCYKCGSPIHRPSVEPSKRYQLDEKFKLSGLPRTNLEYSHGRVWLLDGGFERLHEFVNQVCNLAYRVSCSISPADDEGHCYDTISDIHFPRYDTDFYPPDGLHGRSYRDAATVENLAGVRIDLGVS